MPTASHEILTRNLRSLAAAGGEDLILPVESADVQTQMSPSGAPEVRIRGVDDRWVRLTGKHPEAAAVTLLSERLADAPPEVGVILIGPALGHVVEAIFTKYPRARVVTLEPDPAIARQMLARRSWQPWIERDQLALLIGPEYRGASSGWSVIDGQDPDPIVLINPVIEREWNESVVAARAVAARIVFDARANAEARRRFEGRYVMQTLRNLPAIARSPDVGRLFGRFAGVPAIMVGAGPSLDTVLPSLAEARPAALVVAVDTALRPLLEHGIAPDLVITVDPSVLNARHLTDLPPTPETWLVAEPSVHPSAFEHFAGRTFIFKVGSHHPWPWLMAAGLDCALLHTWGSVITSGFDLLRQMGCDPLIFVGADCAYSGGQPYCRGTAFERDWAEQVSENYSLADVWQATLSERALAHETDVRGVETATAPHLLAFRDWIVDRSRESGDLRVINATGAGLLQGGDIQLAELGSVLAATGKDVAPPDRESLRALGTAHAADLEPGLDALTAAVKNVRETADGPVGTPLTEWLSAVGEEESAELLAVLDQLGETLEQTCAISSPSDQPDLPGPRQRVWPPEQRLVLDAFRRGRDIPDVRTGTTGRGKVRDWLQVALDRLVVGTPRGYQAITANEALAQAALAGRANATRDDTHPGQPTERPVDLRDPCSEGVQVPVCDPQGERQLIGIAIWLALASAASDRPLDLSDQIFTRLVEAVGSGAGDAPPLRGQQLGTRELECRLTLTHGRKRTSGHAMLSFDKLGRALTGAFRETPANDSASAGEFCLSRTFQSSGAVGEIVVRRLGSSVPGVYDCSWPIQSGTSWTRTRSVTLPSSEDCFYATQLPGGRAAVVGATTGRSYEVGHGEEIHVHDEWPAPISGLIPWGSEGGFVAWTGEIAPRLFVRQSADASVESFPFPAHAHTALPTSDGVILPTINGGVWRWSPAKGCTLLIPTPPVSSARCRDGRFQFDPIVVTSGPQFPRVRLDYTWTWAPGETAAHTVPVEPVGQCFSEVTHSSCTARVFPFSDLIRLSVVDGPSFDLHVAQPLMAAWVQPDTLLVTTRDATVLAFDDLLARCTGEGHRS